MSDQAQALATHNAARQDAVTNHGSTSGPLVWDNNLANDAQNWANYLMSIGQLQHSTGTGEGENLYSSGSTSTPFNDATKDWCGEESKYTGGAFGTGNWESYGHYSQIVWPSTTAVGMGSAVDSSGNTYVVARYSPEGNVTGQPVWGLGGTATPGAPASTQDGVYLVNSTKGSQWTSGFAWYASMGNNDGQQPGAYINIDTASTVTWEGSSFSGTFPDGNVFNCNVNADGQTVPFGTAVGTASNNSHGFTVYKDNGRALYEIDGWTVYTIYWCK